ncbi:monooxygenase [Cellulomonas algicola]|uniref:Monooxygenase n=1 Tax=Cellulomonas algicola TaxID=2071633 RepID=A0A401UV07_9CELL|nr:monooxygenase [Cellulomonas algicola]GCD18508.1 monooxygenase [Cellulomonas algicola]
MAHLLFFDFPTDGPVGDEAVTTFGDLAADIAAEDGLLWKVWTEDAEAGTAGGAYLFTDRASAERYLAKHTARLAGFGITDVTTFSTPVNAGLSAITHAPVPQQRP